MKLRSLISGLASLWRRGKTVKPWQWFSCQDAMILAGFAAGYGIIFVFLSLQTCHGESFSWKVATSGPDLLLQLVEDNALRYNLYIGGGGCIEVINGAGDIMAFPPAPGDQRYTDEVDQAVCWATSVIQPGIPGVNDPRWNINQSGDYLGNYQPVIAVTWSPSKQQLDVWTVCLNQWEGPAMNSVMSGFYPLLTRYYLLPNGVLGIRRVLITPNILSRTPYAWVYQDQTPLLPVPYFNRMAFRFDQDGTDTCNWSPLNGQAYNHQESNGYAVWMPGTAGALVAQVSGDINDQSGLGAGYVPESSSWWGGFSCTLILWINSCPAGVVIDTTKYLILRTGNTAEFQRTLAATVSNAAAASVYGPDAVYPGDLAAIVPVLRSLMGQPGHYTRQLSNLTQLIP